MTIREWIVDRELKMFEERLGQLINLDAPEIMIINQKKEVEELRNGNLKIGGDAELLNVEVVDFKKKVGNGGKVYVQFNNEINYFPTARYGRYIARNNKK